MDVKEERLRPKQTKKGRREVINATSIDFTIGQTRWEERYRVYNQMLCHIIQKVLREESSIEHDGLFYKCVKNWRGELQKGLVVNSNGEFLCILLKKVHIKKLYLRKIVFCTTILVVSMLQDWSFPLLQRTIQV